MRNLRAPRALPALLAAVLATGVVSGVWAQESGGTAPATPAAPAAEAAPAATPVSGTGQVEQYQRRIRQAVTPDEVRLACKSPSGSLTINDEIIVCAERDPNHRYRVPEDAARRPVDPEQDSPTARANATMSAHETAPVGSMPDKATGALNPVALGKTIKKLIEKGTEDQD